MFSLRNTFQHLSVEEFANTITHGAGLILSLAGFVLIMVLATFKGDFWHIRVENPIPEINMGRTLRPYQKPHPQIAMSIVKGTSMAARMAGQRG